jgi:hypothetical protein
METPIDIADLRARWWLDHDLNEPTVRRFFWRDNRVELVIKSWLDAWAWDVPGQFQMSIHPDELNTMLVLWDSDNEDTESVVLQGNLSEWIDDFCEELTAGYWEPEWNLDRMVRPLEEARANWRAEWTEGHNKSMKLALEWADHLATAAERLRAAVHEASNLDTVSDTNNEKPH